MKFILMPLLFTLLAVISAVYSAPAIPNKNDSADNNQASFRTLNIIDIDSLKDSVDVSKQAPRFRRDCDCTTTTGRCVPYGNYQCYFDGGPSIVQCVGGNRWVTISHCGSSCRSLGNDQPYCS